MTYVLPTVLVLIAVGVVWFCYTYGLIGLTELPRPWDRIVKAVVAVLVIGGLLAMTVSRFLPDIPAWRPVTATLLTGVAFLFYLALGLALIIVADFIWRFVDRRRGAAAAPRAPRRAALPAQGASASQARRLTIWRIAVAAVTACSLLVTGYGLYAAHHVKTTEVEVSSSDLPPAFDGYRIALISDIHLGPSLSGQFVADVVAQVNQAGPDLIVIAGDLVDGPVDQLGGELSSLGDLQAPDGVVVTTGNHEFAGDVDAWLAFFNGLGLKVLDNSGFEVVRSGAVIDILGINDRQGSGAHSASLPEAVQFMAAEYNSAVDGRDRFRLLVAHEPVQVFTDDDLPASVGIDVLLSGHTHGGQLWPLDLAVRLQQPVVDGVHEVAGVTVVTTKGIGSWGPPVRVGAWPEVVVVTLRPA
jgi:predicted MPP superfamily phosphohydrolase